jgi:PadR family transcriptional regulator, regulatory protein PadR
MTDYIDNWAVQARKGVLELAILVCLADRECYTYELFKLLSNIPGLNASEGTLYPLLSRLRVQGLVDTRLEESPEGPARKYYRLTQKGLENLAMMDTYFNSMLTGIRAIRNGKD